MQMRLSKPLVCVSKYRSHCHAAFEPYVSTARPTLAQAARLMSKKFVLICAVIIACIAAFALWKTQPNSTQQATLKATVCNTLVKNPQLMSEAEVLEGVQFNFENSTPSYALHQPKFHANYAQQLVQDYLKQTPAQQQHIKQDYQYCFSTFYK